MRIFRFPLLRSKGKQAIASLMGFILLSQFLLSPVLAAPSTTWNFSSASGYTLSDSSKVEISGGNAQLKLQTYTVDADTKLYSHLDENSGHPSDSSSNNNAITNSNVTYTSTNFNNGAVFNGTNAQLQVADSSSTSFPQSHTMEAWVKFSNAFAQDSSKPDQGLIDKGVYQLYFDRDTGKLKYELSRATANDWVQKGGSNLLNGNTSSGIEGSWDVNGKSQVQASVVIGTDLYVGLGAGASDAEVWKWNGTVWSMVGGDGTGWVDNRFEAVRSLATDGTDLFVGLGDSTGDAYVYKLTVASSTWSKIGGDGTGSAGQSWVASTYEVVQAMVVSGSTLYVGLGKNAGGDAEVWSCSISSCSVTAGWSKLGGDGTGTPPQSFGSAYEGIYAMAVSGTTLLVGLGSSTGDAELWGCTIGSCAVASGWSKLGGDGTGTGGQSWGSGLEIISSLAVSGTKVFVGTGNTANAADGQVWTCDLSGTCSVTAGWTLIAGDGTQNWGAAHEQVHDLRVAGTTLYAAVGSGGNNQTGDNELWTCPVSTCTTTGWTKIGGDGTGFNTTHSAVGFVNVIGSTVYAGLSHIGNSVSAEVWKYESSTWSRIGGNAINKSWGFYGLQSVESMTVHGDKLYVGTGQTTAGNALVYEYNGSAWTLVGGQGINSSWAANTFEVVQSMTSYNGNLVVGLGSGTGDAFVYSYNGSTWSVIGGSGSGTSGQSWTNAYEYVYSMTVFQNDLYVGLGVSTGDAEVWKCTGSCTTTSGWTKVGGDASGTGGQSWASAHEWVRAMTIYNNQLVVALGNSAGGDAEVWACAAGCTTTTGWSKLGGDGTETGGQSFGVTYEEVDSLAAYNGKLYVGLGNTQDDGEVWECTGSCTVTSGWTKVGGDGVNSSWGDGVTNRYERVRSMAVYNGELYAGLGSTAGDSEVWKYDGTSWSKIGGDGVNNGWTNIMEDIYVLNVYNGKLYAGTGNTANSDATVWAYGNNAVLTQSTTAITDTNWHHIAAVYDGSAQTMSLYIDGSPAGTLGSISLTLSDQNNSMLIGSTLGARGAGETQGYFAGTIDEVRISDVARQSSDFILSPYTTSPQTVTLNTAAYTSQVKSFDSLTASPANPANVTFRLSDNGGTTWKWWDAAANGGLGAWSTSSSLSEANDRSTVSTRLGSFPVTTSGIRWQAVLSSSSSGFTGASVTSLTLNVTEDTTAPSNPTVIDGYSMNGGVSISSGNWYEHATPYFSWSGASDGVGAGVAGYYVYFGTSAAGDPVNDGAYQTGTTYTASSLVNGQTYYLRIQTKDSAGNTQGTIWDAFTYKYDTDNPTNPTTLTSLSQNGGSAITTNTWYSHTAPYFSWSGATDGGSSLSGYYVYFGTSVSGDPVNDGSFQAGTTFSPGGPLVAGSTYYLRIQSKDVSNKVSTSVWAPFIYKYDPTTPTNPTTLTSLSANGGATITTNTWYNHAAPEFSWTGANDVGGSAIAGYYVYFGTSVSGSPVNNGTFQTGSTYTPGTLVSGTTYYLRIQAKDGANNVDPTVWSPFIYKYDGSAATNPVTVTVDPAGYAPTNNFTFTWPAVTDSASGLAGYEYKTGTPSGTLSNWTLTTNTTVTIANAAYQAESNTFYLRTKDNAGNYSTPMQALYYFAGDGPSAPQNVRVSPATNTANSFAFAWDAPLSYNGIVNELTYCWMVNETPTKDACDNLKHWTSAGATSLSAFAAGTRTGLNTFYLVARNSDSTGGAANYGAYSQVTFEVNTTEPGVPQNVEIADVSVKATSSWKLALSWEAPAFVGSGVSKYEIHRSLDGVTYEQIATTTGIAYVDTGLDQETYYYKVRACDNVNNCGSYTEAVSLLPDGRYTSAAGLSSGPTVSAITTKSAIVKWSTDRNADSRVQYGTSSKDYFPSEPSNSTQTTDHSISLTNLTPGTKYYFKVKWTDEDGNIGSSEEKTFETSPSPFISNVKALDVSINSAEVTLTVRDAVKITVQYGKSTSYGGVETISVGKAESDHTIRISSLDEATVYHYRIAAEDDEANVYYSDDYTFETLPVPKIASLKVQQVAGLPTATIRLLWQTNTPVSSIVTYYPKNNSNAAKDSISLSLKMKHEVVLRDLLDDTEYLIVIKGKDTVGNEATAVSQTVKTAVDFRPPDLLNMNVESTIVGIGDQARAQIIVSWDTDEPATTQVEYAEGTGGVYNVSTQEDTNLTTNHVVTIPGLSPARIYHLRAVSKDKAKNSGQSADTVIITPKSTKDALNLVIDNLSNTFGFLRSVAPIGK